MRYIQLLPRVMISFESNRKKRVHFEWFRREVLYIELRLRKEGE